MLTNSFEVVLSDGKGIAVVKRASIEPWFHCWAELVLLVKAQRPVVWFCTVPSSFCEDESLFLL